MRGKQLHPVWKSKSWNLELESNDLNSAVWMCLVLTEGIVFQFSERFGSDSVSSRTIRRIPAPYSPEFGLREPRRIPPSTLPLSSRKKRSRVWARGRRRWKSSRGGREKGEGWPEMEEHEEEGRMHPSCWRWPVESMQGGGAGGNLLGLVRQQGGRG